MWDDPADRIRDLGEAVRRPIVEEELKVVVGIAACQVVIRPKNDARALCIDRGKGQCSQERPEVDGPVFPDGTDSDLDFSSELLIERLERLPRKGETSPTSGGRAGAR